MGQSRDLSFHSYVLNRSYRYITESQCLFRKLYAGRSIASAASAAANPQNLNSKKDTSIVERMTSPFHTVILCAVVVLAILSQTEAKLSGLTGRKLRESLEKDLANIDAAQARSLGLTSSQVSLVNAAWAEIEAAEYPNAVVFGSDRAAVYRQEDTVYGTDGETSGYACWVMAEETSSDDMNDWMNNLDAGSEDISSIKKYLMQDSSCGCKSYSWWGLWCSEYKTCEKSRSYESGYDGFVKAYNGMRDDIYSRMQSACNPEDRLILTGYSRGAGIINALAYVIYKDDLWDTSKIVQVTFGSPRTLSDDLSDEVHGQFDQLRIIYKKDAVPSVPYSILGFKHYGTMRCFECGYEEGRDNPYWSWFVDNGIDDHVSYADWLPISDGSFSA